MGASAETVSSERDAPSRSSGQQSGSQPASVFGSASRDPIVDRLFGAESLSVPHLKAPVLQRAQRTYGNRASQQWAMRAGVLQRHCTCGGTCSKCREDEKHVLQRFTGIPSGAGAALDTTVRRPLEAHFGADLTDVRVHTGSQAADSARDLDALAYTSGRDIYFAQGMYAPSSGSGRRLLAHEVAHVVQQSAGKEPALATKLADGVKVGGANDALEGEAANSANHFMNSIPSTGQPQPMQRQSASLDIVMRQQDPKQSKSDSPSSSEGAQVEVDCGANLITLQQESTIIGYPLTQCDLSDGVYENVTVSVNRPPGAGPSDGDVRFQIADVPTGTRFQFKYTVGPGQPSPAYLLKDGQKVRIVAHSATNTGTSTSRRELPVTYSAWEISFNGTPLAISPVSEFTSSLGSSSNILASGDLSWLGYRKAGADMAAGRILSAEYWAPMIPRPDLIPAERALDVLPRDLQPHIKTTASDYWVENFGFSKTELESLPELVARWRQSGPSSLAATELEMLRRAAGRHGGAAGGQTEGTPFASYTRPGTDLPFSNPEVPLPGTKPKLFRVKVELDPSVVLDISGPNEFNEGGAIPELMNEKEFELLVTEFKGRILSVERAPKSSPGFIMGNAGAIRWGGRIIFVAGAAISAARVINADAEHRGQVAAEEVGGQVFGALGTAVGAAGCAALAGVTAGAGLFLCGLTGGILFGAGGSALGGRFIGPQNPQAGINARPMTEAEKALFGPDFAVRNNAAVCPNCHEGMGDSLKKAFGAFPVASPDANGAGPLY